MMAMAAVGVARTSRAERTRELLLRAAERIVAEGGPGALSLRRAAAEAGQGNTNAASYHFATVDNLVWSVIQRRALEMEPARAAAYEALLAEGGGDDLAGLFACMIDPIAAIVDDDGDHIFARFQLQLYVNQHPYSQLLREVASPELPARSRLLAAIGDRIERDEGGQARFLLPSLLILPFNVMVAHDRSRRAGASPPPLADLCGRAYAAMAGALASG